MKNKIYFQLLFMTFVVLSCKTTNIKSQITFDMPEAYCTNLNLFSDLSKYVSDTLIRGEFFGKDVFIENEKYIYKPKTDKITYKNPVYFKYRNHKNKNIVLVDSVDVYKNFQYTHPYISQVVCIEKRNVFIEIKNSSYCINNYEGNFYLALYLNGKSTNDKPDSIIDIGNIQKNKTKVFRSSFAKLPEYALNKSTIWEELNLYDGLNDKIILTTSYNETAYENKIDEFNLELSEKTNVSYVKTNCDKLCKQNETNKNLDWIYFTKDEITKVNSLTNAEIGRHYNNSITFRPIDQTLINGYWDESEIANKTSFNNESLPDRSRNIYLQFDYKTEFQGEFEAFYLELGHFVQLIIGQNNKIIVHNQFELSEEANIVFQKNGKFEYQKNK